MQPYRYSLNKDFSLNIDSRNSVFPCEKMGITSTSLQSENAKFNIWLQICITLAQKSVCGFMTFFDFT